MWGPPAVNCVRSHGQF